MMRRVPISAVVLLAGCNAGSEGVCAINGAARGASGWLDAADILRPGKTLADLGPLIGRGSALCD